MTQLACDRCQFGEVLPDGKEIGDGEEQGCDHQGRMNRQGGEYWREEEHGGANNQVKAGVEHQVDLAHIVGGTRHSVANGLKAMEGHALAQQADVEFFTDISLHKLTQPFSAEVAGEL